MKNTLPTCTVDEALERQAKPGWLIPYLGMLDDYEADIPADIATPGKPRGAPYSYRGHGRWTWWMDGYFRGEVPTTPIPPVHFESHPNPVDNKAIREVLKPFVEKGLGWWDDAWLALVRWILFGLAYQPDEMEVDRTPAEIRATWYRTFNLGNLLHSPCDWSAHALQGGLTRGDNRGSKWSKTTGFFSTPMNVVKMMTEMTFGHKPQHEDKFLSVLDPCVGTGSMLLEASNYSLRLFGVDIVYDLCLCSILNGYLWMPWLVKMPAEMRDLLEAGPDSEPVPVGVKLSTDPRVVARIEAERATVREAARQGELVQVPLLW